MTYQVAALYVDRDDPMASVLDPEGTLADRFCAKVSKNGPVVREELGPCWVWTGSKDRKGYGRLGCGSKTKGNRKPYGAHRLSWWLAYGVFPKLCVLHRCDNPTCVRPLHLWLGTVGDNNRDMFAKGRNVVSRVTGDASGARKHPERLARGDLHYSRTQPHRLARGEKHGNTRLTADDVIEIRAARARGESLREIGERFGISDPSVSAIAKRRTWGHVP